MSPDRRQRHRGDGDGDGVAIPMMIVRAQRPWLGDQDWTWADSELTTLPNGLRSSTVIKTGPAP